MSDINEADLTALLAELRDHAANGYKTCQYAALTALVAERDALKQRVAELESQQPAASDLREQMSAMMSWMTHVTDMIVIHGLNADHAKIELSRRIDRAIVAANKHGGGA